MRRAALLSFSGPASVATLVLAFLIPLSACKRASQATAELQQQPANPIEAALMQCDYAKALALAQAGAKANDAAAQFYLGRLYQEGWGVRKEPRTALEHYQAAATAGYVRANIFAAGIFLATHSAQNKEKARRLLHEAADQGDVQGKYLAMIQDAAQSPNSPEREARFKQALENAAAAGDPIVNFMLGTHYAEDAQHGNSASGKLAVKAFLAAARSDTQMPGELAASTLFESGMKLGGNADDIKQALTPYGDAGGLFLASYVSTCVKNAANPVCDPVQVIKWGKEMVLGGAPVITASYLSSVSAAQRQQGETLAASWKPHPLPSVPADFFILPELTGQ